MGHTMNVNLMKKYIFVLLIFFISFSSLKAQSYADLTKTLAAEMIEVTTAKEKWTQSMSHSPNGVITYKLESTALKDGKTIPSTYEFNLADIDFNTIRALTDKDIINVQLLAVRKQDLIKHTENNKWTYERELQIPAKDIGHARNIVDILRLMHPLAIEQVDKRLLLNSESDRMNWLEKNVKIARLNGKSIEQKLSFDKNIPGRVTIISTEINNQKSTETEYQFNIANINPNSLVLDVKTDHIEINIATRRNLKLIKATQLGVLKNYQNDMVIYSESVENSRDLVKVIRTLTEGAENKIVSSVPTFNTTAEGLALINKYVAKVSVNKTIFEQVLKGDCIVELTQSETDASSSLKEQFNFNLKDLLKTSVIVSVSGTNLLLSIKTKAGSDLIKYMKNQEAKNYTNELKFHFQEIEEMFQAESIFKQMIETCEKTEKNYPKDFGSLKKNIIQAVGKVADIKTEYAQSILIDDKNSITFKITETSNQKSNEKIYECKSKDLNAQQLSFKTDGNKVYVEFSTNYLEKIIKYYENGEIKTYQTKFRIYTNTLEEARDLHDQFKLFLSQ